VEGKGKTGNRAACCGTAGPAAKEDARTGLAKTEDAGLCGGYHQESM